MSRHVGIALVALSLTITAPSLAAQDAAAATAAATAASITGPRVELARVGVSAPVVAAAAVAEPSLVPQNPALRRRGVPQMIIGGVAILGGAIIGDDVGTIISLGGLAYGIYGLYLYLN